MADSTETSSEVPVPCLVTPGLWTCGESAVPSALLNLGITHLVSIGYPPPEDPCCGVKGVEVLCLELEDEDDGDLLTQIPTAVAFIQNGLAVFQAGLEGESIDDSAAAGHTNRKKTGGVLVHCHAGSSRSVAVAMAQVMRVSTMDVDTCLALVKKNNEHASPNEGFIAQLNLWHSMDCKLSTVNTAFKMYLTSKMQREREHNGYVESTSVRPDPGAPVNAPGSAASVTPFSGASAQTVAGPSEPNGGGPEAGVLIGCRKCRRLVARGANALPHELGQGMDAFSWRKRTKAKGQESVAMNQCQHIFLEPLAWMKGVEEGPVEGKLCCPKCDVKLGLFNWVGSRCACGAFVSPAFYVQASKVDVMKCKE